MKKFITAFAIFAALSSVNIMADNNNRTVTTDFNVNSQLKVVKDQPTFEGSLVHWVDPFTGTRTPAMLNRQNPTTLGSQYQAKEIFHWIDPFTGTKTPFEVGFNSEILMLKNQAQANEIFHWIDPSTGTKTPFEIGFKNFDTSTGNVDQTAISAPFRIDTEWRTIMVDTIPSTSTWNGVHLGVHSSTNIDVVQMRVVRSQHDVPVQIIAGPLLVGPGTSFTANIGRGNVFAVQARVLTEHSDVRFTSEAAIIVN